MSDKNKVRVEETRCVSSEDSATKGILAFTLLFLLGGAAIRSGVELGKDISNKIIRQRDKDVRRLERREERERKEQRKREKREEKERLKRERGCHWYD